MSNNSVVKVFPSLLSGAVKAPPSKSLSHRALICAGLSKGTSVISNLIYSEDIIATMSSLEKLGVKFHKKADKVTVQGVKKIKKMHEKIDCNESGSTIRFLIPLFSLSNEEVIFTGKDSLINRPHSVYKEIYESQGSSFDIINSSIMVNGSIKPNIFHIKGNVSSQFFSGLMFALPLLDEDSTIYIDGILESKSYIDLTIDILDHYGIKVLEIENGYFIEGNQTYIPRDYKVEGDYSQAAFYLVGGVLNGHIKVSELNHSSLQGDRSIIELIKSMKGRVIYLENGFITELSKTYSTVIDLSNTPDLGPIIALLASLSEGETIIKNISRLRLKESDRVYSTVSTLKALGADITSTENEITINGKEQLKGGVTVDTFNDHRIEMMLCIAATRCKYEITISNAMAVNKSYPGFYEDYKSLGGKIK